MSGSEKVIGVLGTAVHHLESAAERLGLDKAIVEKLRRPKEKIELSLSPKMPNGKIVTMGAYVVRHNMTLGPAKGGIRMTADVGLDEIVGLAMEMTWKTSLIGVPFGGGKSGIRCAGSQLTTDEKEVVIRSFTRAVHRHLGPELYIAAPDMGTTEADMGHISDCISYSAGTAITSGCFVTGKPVILGGILGRREATGKGVVYTVEAACEKLGKKIENLRVAVQGFGNVGGAAALEIARRGATIVAAADMSGGVENPDGIDAEALAEHVRDSGGVQGFVGTKAIAKEAVLEAACDVLIPAAAGSQITAANAGQVRASLIAEGANAPTTPEGDAILNERKIFVVPDILCNAGGVFVSYLEYTQETQREQMTLMEVEQRLSERMKLKFDDVYGYAQQHKTSMRCAAMDIAVKQVVDGIYARGLLP